MFGRWKKVLSMGDISRNAEDFGPPIYYAAYFGLRPIVRFLLEQLGDNPLRQDIVNSALAGAVDGGDAEIVQIILAAGADPQSPLCGDLLGAAVASGNITVVKAFIEAKSPICTPHPYEGGALHDACRKGSADAIQVLLDAGFDCYNQCRRTGTPLSSAVIKNQYAAVETLIRNNVDVNVPLGGYYNALNQAAENADIEIMRLLLNNGAAESLKSPASKALAQAARRGSIEMMQLLLDHGADINSATDDFYGTPLKGAIQSRNPKVLEFALANKADINSPGIRERYPVDLAIYSGNIAAAERLLNMGAQFGDTALEEALDHHSKEHLAKILLDRGANPNAEQEKYCTIR
jgi:ankyrin repeat protein